MAPSAATVGNITNIAIFGILGTFVAFFSFSAATIWIKNLYKDGLFMYKLND